ncbi:hypothetical protein L083_2251 [Actinoplanes sp. N902-109]|nr:hypothetical protein L083_2251 [Actinoplanes sp. N902-109]
MSWSDPDSAHHRNGAAFPMKVLIAVAFIVVGLGLAYFKYWSLTFTQRRKKKRGR